MKKIIFLIIFFFNFNNLFAQEEVFFLDVDFMLNNSKQGKIIIEKLKTLNSQNILELKKKEDELKKLESEISNKKNIISKEEQNKMIDNLKKKINLYKSLKNEKVDNFTKFKNDEIEKFFKKITPFIEEFMRKNSIKIILDKKNIFIANSNYDITNQIVEFLDTKVIK